MFEIGSPRQGTRNRGVVEVEPSGSHGAHNIRPRAGVEGSVWVCFPNWDAHIKEV